MGIMMRNQITTSGVGPVGITAFITQMSRHIMIGWTMVFMELDGKVQAGIMEFTLILGEISTVTVLGTVGIEDDIKHDRINMGENPFMVPKNEDAGLENISDL